MCIQYFYTSTVLRVWQFGFSKSSQKCSERYGTERPYAMQLSNCVTSCLVSPTAF